MQSNGRLLLTCISATGHWLPWLISNISRLSDLGSDGAADGLHAVGVEHGGEIAGIVDETEFDEPAFIEFHDGERFVLAFILGFGSAIGNAEGIGNQGAEALGFVVIIAAAVEDFAAAGFAVGAVAVQGNHHLGFVGAGDVIASIDGRGILRIAAGADDGVTGGAEDVAETVGVTQGDVGFGVSFAVEDAGGSGVVFEATAVRHSMTGIEANGKGHAAAGLSKIGKIFLLLLLLLFLPARGSRRRRKRKSRIEAAVTKTPRALARRGAVTGLTGLTGVTG